MNKELRTLIELASKSIQGFILSPQSGSCTAMKLQHLHLKVWWSEVLCYGVLGPICKNN